MEWLVIIGIVLVVGYFWLKGYAVKEQQARIDRANDRLDKNKDRLDKYYQEEYREALTGKNLILNDRDDTIDYMVRQETERQLLHLWNKHYITVMASDKFSQESKSNLSKAWFNRLSSEVYLIDAIEYGYDDIEATGDACREAYQTFTATLEAFGYDPDKETTDTKEQVTKGVKEHYKGTTLPMAKTNRKKASKKRVG